MARFMSNCQSALMYSGLRSSTAICIMIHSLYLMINLIRNDAVDVPGGFASTCTAPAVELRLLSVVAMAYIINILRSLALFCIAIDVVISDANFRVYFCLCVCVCACVCVFV